VRFHSQVKAFFFTRSVFALSSKQRGHFTTIMMTSSLECISAVTNHTADYIDRWCILGGGGSSRPAFHVALLLVAAGTGPARVPTCEHCLMHVHLREQVGFWTVRCLHQLLLRALSLYGPGELQALRVADPMVLDLVLASRQEQEDTSSGPSAAADPTNADDGEEVALLRICPHRMSEALESLRVVAWPPLVRDDVSEEFALIERHAATIRELDCPLEQPCSLADRALASCTRLESLTSARLYDPAAWLGLSQLHTLRDVDLGVVSVGEIADALPQLRTLHAFVSTRYVLRYVSPAAVAGFFECLLPRLRVFHFNGKWPKGDGFNAPYERVPQQRLPRLQELVWQGTPIDSDLLTGFIGAEPLVLHVPDTAITAWLAADNASPWGLTHSSSLDRVRDLNCVASTATDVANVLRAARQLRGLTASRLRGGLSSLLDPHSTFAVDKLVRPWVQVIHLHSLDKVAPAPDCATQLRQRFFPRLRRLTLDGRELPVE
jgi:hypothetical protein